MYSQGWNICGKKGMKRFSHQEFSPSSCHSVQKCWTHSECPLPAGAVVQLLHQTRRGHLDLPLDASRGCKTMVWSCLVQLTKYEQLHGVRRKLVLLGGECALSSYLSPGLAGALLPCRARASGMEKHTDSFRWTFQDIAGMKRVFEWILEVKGHSLRDRLCKM